MKVPPILTFGRFAVQKSANNNPSMVPFQPPLKDAVAFSSNARYLKKYVTLPDEIKSLLSPKDAIDMFKDMEYVASGVIKGKKIGQGEGSNVYDTPWLENYCFVILDNPYTDTQIIYSAQTLKDAIWCDKDDIRLQIMPKTN